MHAEYVSFFRILSIRKKINYSIVNINLGINVYLIINNLFIALFLK